VSRGWFDEPTEGFPYKVLAGNIGRLTHQEKARQEGIANLVTATDWANPKAGIPWALDNGAYAAWRNDEPFPEEDFLSSLDKIPSENPPTFVVAPDKVAAGTESLAFTERWLDGPLERVDLPYYLAVQDGIRPGHVEDRGLVDRIDGIFVGGKLNWKRRTTPFWVDWAHDHDLPVHVGRVGTVRWMLWAARVGVDSIDSSSWTRNDRMEIIDQARRALRDQTHLRVEQ